MKGSIIFILLLFSKILIFGQNEPSQVYRLLNTGTSDEIKAYLDFLANQDQNSLTKAYRGTLLMRDASFEKTPLEKLEAFKEGRIMLEAEISANPENMEYRFLRFIIQENAPVILRYDQQLSEDKTKIIEGYDLADKLLQDQIKTYCNYSKLLKLSDLKL